MFSRVLVVRGMTAAMLVVVLTPHPAPAQQTDSLPSRALINAFVRMYAPGDSALTPEFEAATMPASLQSVVHLPPMTNVIGTVTLGRTAYVLASSPVAPDSLMRLAAREYARPGAPTIGRVEIATTTAGGFRAAPSPFSTTYCVDNREVSISAARTADGITNVRYRVTPGSTFCARVAAMSVRAPAEGARSTPAVPTSPLPILREPGMPSALCYGGNSQRTQSSIQSTMEPAALLTHYADQMMTQGWTRVDSSSTVARGMWTRRDSSGVMQMATIVVGISPLSSSCRDETIEVTVRR